MAQSGRGAGPVSAADTGPLTYGATERGSRGLDECWYDWQTD